MIEQSIPSEYSDAEKEAVRRGARRAEVLIEDYECYWDDYSRPAGDEPPSPAREDSVPDSEEANTETGSDRQSVEPDGATSSKQARRSQEQKPHRLQLSPPGDPMGNWLRGKRLEVSQGIARTAGKVMPAVVAPLIGQLRAQLASAEDALQQRGIDTGRMGDWAGCMQSCANRLISTTLQSVPGTLCGTGLLLLVSRQGHEWLTKL